MQTLFDYNVPCISLAEIWQIVDVLYELNVTVLQFVANPSAIQ